MATLEPKLPNPGSKSLCQLAVAHSHKVADRTQFVYTLNREYSSECGRYFMDCRLKSQARCYPVSDGEHRGRDLTDPLDDFRRFSSAGFAPRDELDWVDPSLAAFDLGHERIRLPKLCAQFSNCQARALTKFSENLAEVAVSGSVLNS